MTSIVGFTDLPPEMKYSVISFLDKQDVFNLQATSKQSVDNFALKVLSYCGGLPRSYYKNYVPLLCPYEYRAHLISKLEGEEKLLTEVQRRVTNVTCSATLCGSAITSAYLVPAVVSDHFANTSKSSLVACLKDVTIFGAISFAIILLNKVESYSSDTKFEVQLRRISFGIVLIMLGLIEKKQYEYEIGATESTLIASGGWHIAAGLLGTASVQKVIRTVTEKSLFGVEAVKRGLNKGISVCKKVTTSTCNKVTAIWDLTKKGMSLCAKAAPPVSKALTTIWNAVKGGFKR